MEQTGSVADSVCIFGFMIESILSLGGWGIVILIIGGVLALLVITLVLAVIGLLLHATGGIFSFLAWCIRPVLKLILIIIVILLFFSLL